VGQGGERVTQAPSGALSTALGGLIAIAAALGIGRFVYTPILPVMVEALGLSKSQAGLIASANFLGYLIGALFAAMPQLSGSRRLWLIGSLAASAATTAGMGLSQSLAGLLVLRFVGGAASAFVLIFSSTQCWSAWRSSAATNSRHCILPASAPGSRCPRRWWRDCSSLVKAGSRCGSRAAPSRSWRSSRRRRCCQRCRALRCRRLERRALLPMPRCAVLSWPTACSASAIITATFLVAIVRATPAIQAQEPVIWIVFGIAAAPSVAFWTLLASRFGIQAAFAMACIVEALGVLASVAWPSVLGVFLAAILVGGTFMGLTALGLMGARARAVGDPRRVLALMTGAFGLGQIVGPLFAGIASDWLGSFTAPSIVAALALILAALLAAR